VCASRAYARGHTFPTVEKLWQTSQKRQGKDTFVSSLVWCHALGRGETPGCPAIEEVKFLEPPLVAPASKVAQA